MTEAIVLDPAGIAVNRTEVNITNFISPDGPDWGDADIEAYVADRDIGSSPVGFRLPNRVITIPLVLKNYGAVSFTSIRNKIQHKCALCQREGGWIMRQVDSTPLYADITKASLHLGGSYLQAFKSADVDAVLMLETIPDWYGVEITLDTLTCTPVFPGGPLQLASANAKIAGNYPARVKIAITDTSNTDQKSLIWGFRSRNYDPAASAVSMLSARDLTMINGALAGGIAESTNNAVAYLPVLPAKSWTPFLGTTRTYGTPQWGLGQSASDVAGVGTVTWSNPLNLTFGDPNNPATAALTASAITHFLRTGSYGMNIASNGGETLSGIEVRIKRKSANGLVKDSQVKLLDETGTLLTTDKASAAAWGTTYATVSYGGPADLWGRTSAAWNNGFTFNSGSAGVSFVATATGTDTASVAEIKLIVYWNPSAADIAPMTHKGSYRVWITAGSADGTPSIRLVWGVGSLSVPSTNDPVKIPASGSGLTYLMDMGTVRLDPVAVSSSVHSWQGVFQAYTDTACSVFIHRVYLQPLDESSGRLLYTDIPPASSASVTQDATVGADNAAVGTVAWVNPNNGAAEDGSIANTPSLTTGQISHYLVSSAHGFSVPSTATVLGIQLQVKKSATSAHIVDNSVKLVKAGSVAGSTKADLSTPWPATLTFVSYGGPTDLWGTTWTPSDVNASNFGAAISCQLPSSNLISGQVDAIRITVFFTLSSGFTVAQDAVVYANQVSEINTDGAWRSDSGSKWAPVGQVLGQLPRIPPSGIENRPVEFFLRPSHGDLDQLQDTFINETDIMNVVIKYRPSFLFVGT